MVEPAVIILAIVSILILVAGILLIVFGSRRTHPGMMAIGIILLPGGVVSLIMSVWLHFSQS